MDIFEYTLPIELIEKRHKSVVRLPYTRDV
jgi:hypothetical protein